MSKLHGAVVFTSGSTPLPEDHWYFEMDSWEVFQGGLAAYRVDRTSEFEDPGLFFYVISGAHSVEEIPVDGRGTSFLGGGGASYILAPVTVIEYPATTIGLKFASDPSSWTVELWGHDFSDGVGSLGLLDSRSLSDSRKVEWTVEDGHITFLEITNAGLEPIDSLVIDNLYIGDFLGDPVPESQATILIALCFCIALGKRKRELSSAAPVLPERFDAKRL